MLLTSSCPPACLLFAGKILHGNLRRCLLATEKLRSELRANGHATLAGIFAVVLEPTGTFAVISDGELAKFTTGMWKPASVQTVHAAQLGMMPPAAVLVRMLS